MENLTTKERLESAISNLTLTAGAHGNALAVVTRLVKELIQENDTLRSCITSASKSDYQCIDNLVTDITSPPGRLDLSLSDDDKFDDEYEDADIVDIYNIPVRLRLNPKYQGQITAVGHDAKGVKWYHVDFASDIYGHQWVKASQLEFIPYA
ncbi:hypothetical protein KCE64_005148 [Salmonella enterica subsp. enterica serovar Hvittingfoss]|nr:hypothetical protein [Salmonella enterica subsp. enterica serovar Hvittingfoss]EHL2852614.1 hypothetical protein [Salmonella enterica subsp. enterica serovar Hvittingfoss]